MCQIVWLPLVIAFLKSRQSEAVMRIIDNTMVKRKKYKHTMHSSIWARTKPHLWWCYLVVLSEVMSPEVTSIV